MNMNDKRTELGSTKPCRHYWIITGAGEWVKGRCQLCKTTKLFRGTWTGFDSWYRHELPFKGFGGPAAKSGDKLLDGRAWDEMP